MFALMWLVGCEPLMDSCKESRVLDAIPLDEVGEPGFAAVDGLIPAGTYRAVDGEWDLVVTLEWAEQAFPREYEWHDGDGDGVVPPDACPMNYRVKGWITVDSGDGRYDERGSATTGATESGGGSLWVTIDDSDVRGTEVPPKELWLEIFRDGDDLRFGLTEIGLGGDADYRIDTLLVPMD